MQSVMNALRGDSQPRSDRESEGVRQDATEVRGVSPLRVNRGPLIREGVPLADRPTHQQLTCTTCSQSLQQHERQQICHVCSSWIHTNCVEVLNIGDTWRTDMCLTCQQGFTRQLRAMNAIERQRGHPWDQDERLATLQYLVQCNTGYGISDNRDLNDLEIKLGAAINRGLHVYKITGTPSNTGDDDLSGRRDSADGSTPVGIPQAAPAESTQPMTYLSANSAGTPTFRAQQAEGDSSRQEGAGQEPPDQRTGIREEGDARVAEPQTDQAEVQQETRAPVPSVHSERSEAREQKVLILENSISQMQETLRQMVEAMQSRGSLPSDLRGPPPKAAPDSLRDPCGRTPKYPPEENVRENLCKETPTGTTRTNSENSTGKTSSRAEGNFTFSSLCGAGGFSMESIILS